jgi:hypothetical protein
VPLPDATCAVPTDVCCTSIFDVAETIAIVAYDAVAECLDAEDCTRLGWYVSVNEPSYAKGDYVGVWLQSMIPRPGTGTTRANFLPRPQATFGVKLIESGWPTITGNDEVGRVPSIEVMHAIAKHSYGHAERMLRAVYDNYRARDGISQACGFQSIGALRPTTRDANLCGWSFDLSLEIPF